MTVRILQGDCRELMVAMPDQSVQCCVTSPPYFGLRDYGHSEQIGLEPTPEEFVAKLVAVFREVRRVLRDDGTLWLNLGDSYAGSWGAQSREHAGKHSPNVSQISANQVRAAQRRAGGTGSIPVGSGLKAKDLIGIPWMVAFALRADGWYLRQEIIWAKPNPMPESVTDRCTKSHEQIFLLAKSPRYYYDYEAIKEPVAPATVDRLSQDLDGQAGSDRVPGKTNGPMKAVHGSIAARRERAAADHKSAPTKERNGIRAARDSFKRDGSKRAEVFPGQSVGTHRPDRPESEYDLETRNKRSVWTVTTKPFSEAHFATFPPDLIEPCILAGCPVGGVVLDPFGGAGTTGLVADRHQRDAVLLELNPEYAEIARRRIAGDAPLFVELEAV